MSASPAGLESPFALAQAEHLYRGPKSDVYLNSAHGTVTKVYRNAGHSSAGSAARTEFDRLCRLYAAFQEVEGITCPRPISLEQVDGQWCLTMERVPGTPLLSFAEAGPRPAATDVARQLARALTAYEQEIGQPHYGLKPQDIHFVATTGELVLLDFEPSHGAWHLGLGTGDTPARVSAGLLLGRVLHRAAAPRMLRNRAFASWLTEVALETTTRLGVECGDRLADVVWARYERGFDRYACWWRPVWYRAAWLAAGRPALRRVRVDRTPHGGRTWRTVPLPLATYEALTEGAALALLLPVH